MTGKGEPGSETRSRTHVTTEAGSNPRRSSRRWLAPFVLAVAVVLVATSVVALTQSAPRIEEEWSAITLNFGSNPVTQNLNITFPRVSYVSQPTQWNTTGFVNASLVASTGVYVSNSTDYGTDYGVFQVNASTGYLVGDASWRVGSSLGANVSYVFTDQRVALNGSGAKWQYVLSGSPLGAYQIEPTSGSVTNTAAGAAQNEVTVEATYSGGNYSFTAYDWEEAPGGYQNVTAYAFPSSTPQPPLQFFEIYIYMQPLQTVVSIVNTTDGAIIGSTPAMHPVFDSNLTELSYVGDAFQTTPSTAGDAIVLDYSWLIDHNTYTNEPGVSSGAVERGLAPAVSGTISLANTEPFDPSSSKENWLLPPVSSASFSNTKMSLGDFRGVVNSSSEASLTSSLINTSDLVPAQGIPLPFHGFNNTAPSTVNPAQALNTLRAIPEDTTDSPTATLYDTEWTAGSIQSGIHSFLTNVISARTGLPPADVIIPSFLVSDISVWTQFSSQAASTIHDCLASSIPGYLQSNNLALVNRTTGAIDAGADIGEFMDLATGQVHPAQVRSVGSFGFTEVYDPVTHDTYASAEAAGFPAGSSLDLTSGSVYVPGQAAFLGWAADGEPEFGPGGCFIVCLPSGGLSGAASAVSSFFGGAASSVSNAVGSVSTAVSNDVVKPVSGTVSSDLGGLASDVSKAVDTVMPIFGSVGGSVSSAVTKTLGGVSSTLGGVGEAIGSTASGAAGAILGGVNSFTNSVYHVGAAAGSALSTAGGAIENTVGKAVSTAGAVLSNGFAAAGNVLAKVPGLVVGSTESIASLLGQAGQATAGALDTVGSTLEQGLSGAWSALQNAFGAVGSGILNALEFPFKALGSVFDWPTGLSSGVGQILEYVIIGVVAFVIVFLVVWLLFRRSRRSKGRQIGGHERSRARSRHSRAHYTARAAPTWGGARFGPFATLPAAGLA